MPPNDTVIDMQEEDAKVQQKEKHRAVGIPDKSMADFDTVSEDSDREEKVITLEQVEQFVKSRLKGCLPAWFAYILIAILICLIFCLLFGSLLLGVTLSQSTAGKWFGLVFFGVVHHAFVFEPLKVAFIAVFPTFFTKRVL